MRVGVKKGASTDGDVDIVGRGIPHPLKHISLTAVAEIKFLRVVAPTLTPDHARQTHRPEAGHQAVTELLAVGQRR